MNRRTFTQASLATLATAALTNGLAAQESPPATSRGAFKLKYAPHFGTFRHHAGNDPIDQIKFMADEGFTAIEDNGMMGRDPKLQDKIGETLRELKMEMGVFVAYADFGNNDFVTKTDADTRQRFQGIMKRAVETAGRVNARWCTVVPGTVNPRLEEEYQFANCVDMLRACCEICEPAKLTMVLEPLNWFRDHPNVYLQRISQGYAICKAVNSPSCKILDDFYHQQITEGNLIPNLDRAWSEIAYIQVGDNPGRQEPGTGEINYRNIFRHLHRKGYQGIVGMEHGNSQGGKEGERAVINAYKDADNF